MRPATFISLLEAAVANPKFREIALWLKVHRNACDVLPLDWEELTLPHACRTAHAFCIINGKIADPTLGLNSDGHYFGKPLDPAQFKDDAELESFLYKCSADYDATFHYDDAVLTRTWEEWDAKMSKARQAQQAIRDQGWGRPQPAL